MDHFENRFFSLGFALISLAGGGSIFFEVNDTLEEILGVTAAIGAGMLL
ncbi:MAG: hypothetical protein AAF804_21615 [Bacteroidota bacterium]